MFLLLPQIFLSSAPSTLQKKNKENGVHAWFPSPTPGVLLCFEITTKFHYQQRFWKVDLTLSKQDSKWIKVIIVCLWSSLMGKMDRRAGQHTLPALDKRNLNPLPLAFLLPLGSTCPRLSSTSVWGAPGKGESCTEAQGEERVLTK